MTTRAYDILVAGGGTAGAAAAIAAARRGHRVLLVEEQNCLGGTATSGSVGEWFASLDGMGDIFAAVLRELQRFGLPDAGRRFFNPEHLKGVWQLLAEQAGLQILFHASACGVRRRGSRLTEARLVCCSRPLTVRAAFFVDATGEGDLGALAGAEFMQGDATAHRVLHMTLAAWMYDTGKPQPPHLPDGLEPIRGPEGLPGLGAGYHIDPHRVYLNATKVLGYDPTDPFSLSDAEREARRQLLRVAHYVQTHGFPTFALAASGARIGIREGRRLRGDHVLRLPEILARTEPLDFADGIAVATSQIDFHSLTKPGAAGWRQGVLPYSIPLRCLVARGFANLLMAGKCISADQVVHSSCRMTPTCCAMGQAAGTAAALALEAGLHEIRDLPVAELRRRLAADGVELDPRRHTAFSPHSSRLDDDDPAPPATPRPAGPTRNRSPRPRRR